MIRTHYLLLIGSCIILLLVCKLNKSIREIDVPNQEQSTKRGIGMYRIDFTGKYCAEEAMKVFVPRSFKYANALKEEELTLKFTATYTMFTVRYTKKTLGRGFEYLIQDENKFLKLVYLAPNDCIESNVSSPLFLCAEMAE